MARFDDLPERGLPAESDPTAMRNQPALWGGNRRRWLIPAGILCVAAVLMLALTLSLQIIIPWSGIVLTVGLYLTMIGCGIWVRDQHQRNVAFAWLMSGMAVIPLIALALVTMGELSVG